MHIYSTPDETELSGYTLADRIRRQEKYGLEYSNFLLKNSFEKVTSLDYEHWEFREWEGRKVLFRDLYRREEQNENGEIVTTEKTPDLGQRASMKKTATGWRIDIDDTDGMVEFYLYVEDDDELRMHDYDYVTEDVKRPLQWTKDENGWILQRNSGEKVDFFQSVDLVISN